MTPSAVRQTVCFSHSSVHDHSGQGTPATTGIMAGRESGSRLRLVRLVGRSAEFAIGAVGWGKKRYLMRIAIENRCSSAGAIYAFKMLAGKPTHALPLFGCCGRVTS
jgi:hypothetical protein